jgi:hypothetical protein
MDQVSHVMANALVDNKGDWRHPRCAVVGPELHLEETMLVALHGAAYVRPWPVGLGELVFHLTRSQARAKLGVEG